MPLYSMIVALLAAVINRMKSGIKPEGISLKSRKFSLLKLDVWNFFFFFFFGQLLSKKYRKQQCGHQQVRVAMET